MARDLDASLETAFAGRIVGPIFLFAAYFDSGTLRFWTGIGELVWNGDTYFGFGNLIGISKIEETSEARALNASLSLSGVPSEILSVALGETYQGRRARVWIAALEEGVLQGEPYPLHDTFMDVMEIERTATSRTIKMSVETRQVTGTRPRNADYTDEDQKHRHSGDLFFSKVAELQDRSVILKP